MSNERDHRVCSVENAGGLDNPFRRWLQNPLKILKPYIHKGMTIMDMGCGPGFFTIDMAKLLDGSGKVIAVDLQEGMLEKVRQKIKGSELEKRIELHKCNQDETGISEKVDFILCFWMIHEVPDQKKLFQEFKTILNPNGQIFIIEPNFHVSGKSFKAMQSRLQDTGFVITGKPKVLFSRSVLLTQK
jgi:ubiquinone/menaquinone biosynthesis C-methylase UbiE